MKRFLKMAGLFLLPLALAPAVALLVLPLDFFYFRAYEALIVHKLIYFLPGPFYPNLELSMTEQGDLGFDTRHAVLRKNRWVTDQSGQRTREGNGDIDVVLVGDSYIVGSCVDQDDTPAAVLASLLQQRVYPYYQNNNDFFNEQRFFDRPPRAIVAVCVERQALEFWLPNPDEATPQPQPEPNQLFFSIFSGLDRLMKIDFGRSVRASTQRALLKAIAGSDQYLSPRAVLANDDSMLFLKVDAKPQGPIEPFIASADATRRALQKRGVRFIIMIVPNKSTIHADKWDGFVKTDFLERLTQGLSAAGVEVVSLERAFQAERDRGGLAYLPDDSHWNERGIRIAAELLAQRIKEAPRSDLNRQTEKSEAEPF